MPKLALLIILALPLRAGERPAVDLTDQNAVAQAYLAAVRAGDLDAALPLLANDPPILNMVRMMRGQFSAEAAGGMNPWDVMTELAILPTTPDAPIELGEATAADGRLELSFQLARPLVLMLARQDDGTWRVDLRASLTATVGEGRSMMVRQAEMMANMPEQAAMVEGRMAPYEVENQLRTLASALNAYAEEHDGVYPEPDEWCDAIRPYVEGERPFGSPIKPDETYSFAMNAELAEQGPGDDWQVRQRTVLLADVGGNEPNQIFFPDELAAMEPRYGDVNVVATTAENTFQIPGGMSYEDVWAANDRLEATQSRLAALVAALLKYAEQNDGLLPEAATWCDELEPLLEPRAADGGELLVTPGVEVEEGQITFAINAELAGKNLHELVNRRRLAIFFETEPVARNTAVAGNHIGPARHMNAWSPTAPRSYLVAWLNGSTGQMYPPPVMNGPAVAAE